MTRQTGPTSDSAAAAAGGQCPQCGYDLTGNVTGRCPECGRLWEGVQTFQVSTFSPLYYLALFAIIGAFSSDIRDASAGLQLAIALLVAVAVWRATVGILRAHRHITVSADGMHIVESGKALLSVAWADVGEIRTSRLGGAVDMLSHDGTRLARVTIDWIGSGRRLKEFKQAAQNWHRTAAGVEPG